ncbi:HAD family phosphatase [uncultured Methanomethylovorans sp.]|uniref:HAD family hydrolase n=1 Tax=uncultured Methanomethylovorans sp. TaxID=183759 RepID=UPI002AA7C32C|nr:HAD family phosphatase [uncultured Methanomethylovorans sp.]
MLKGLIFDVDGVLMDSMSYHADAWVQAFREVGVPITNRDIYEIEGSNHKGVVDIIFHKAGLEPETSDYETFLKKKREHFLRNNRAEPFKGMQECLQALKEKYKLAVASGADRVIVNTLMDRFYPGIFKIIVSGEDVTRGKPNPEPYLKAASKLGLEPEECIVIENAPLGIKSAKMAGIYCVAVPTYLLKEKLIGADMILADHAELITYLSRLL